MKPIIRKELRDALRNHWLQGYAGILAVLGLVATVAASRGAAGLGVQTFGRTTASLTNLCLLLAPLVALALGAATIAGERDRGTLERLLAQPLERRELLTDKYVGLMIALVAATLVGFAPAGVAVGFAAGAATALTYLLFPALAIVVIAALLGVGVLVSVRSRSGAQAQARAVFLWFVFVMLYDLILMGTLMSANFPPAVLALLLLLNPVSAGRVLVVLALEADLYLLGPAGAWMVQELSPAGAAAVLVGSLLLWTGLSLLLARRAFRLRPPAPTPMRGQEGNSRAVDSTSSEQPPVGETPTEYPNLKRARTT